MESFLGCLSGGVPYSLVLLTGVFLTRNWNSDKATNQMIFEACTKCFLPIYMFIELLNNFSMEQAYWVLLLNPLVISLLGLGLGTLYQKVYKLRTLQTSSLVPNSVGTLPILVLKGMCSSYGPFGGESCSRAQVYLIVQSFTGYLVLWGLSKLQKPKVQEIELVETTQNSVFLEKSNALQKTNPVFQITLAAQVLGVLGSGVAEFSLGNSSGVFYCLIDSANSIGITGVIISQLTLVGGLEFTAKSKLVLVTRCLIYPLVGLVVTKLSIGLFGINEVMAFCMYVNYVNIANEAHLVLKGSSNFVLQYFPLVGVPLFSWVFITFK